MSFQRTGNTIFYNNVRLIERTLPEVLAQILLEYNSGKQKGYY
ncbi:hypothetical protein [Galbibacter sp.]